MAKCTSCGAPLPPSGIICEYCGTRNDIDLREKGPFFMDLRPLQKRTCPVCHVKLHTIDVGEAVPFLVERCESCFGIFFDLHELEEMIERSVKGSRNVDIARLSQITEHPRHVDIVVYRRCPVCRKTMQRKNFMKRSGVITDVCPEHGVWLDSGELRQIFEWVKSGGMERAEEEAASAQEETEVESAMETITPSQPPSRHHAARKKRARGGHGDAEARGESIIDMLTELLGPFRMR